MKQWLSIGSAQKLLGILSAKCPFFLGLLRTAYAKLFLYDPLLGFLILLSVFSSTGYSQAILANYNAQHIGGVGALSAGAFMVRANDPSAAWYNPAGLAKATKDSISGNTSIYERAELKLDYYGESNSSSAINSIPSFLGSVTKKGSFAWGWSVVTPMISFVTSEYESKQSIPFGNDYIDDCVVKNNMTGQFKILSPGVSAAYELIPGFRLGIGARYYQVEYVWNSQTSIIQPYDAGSPYYNELNTLKESASANLLALNVGVQYDLNTNVSLAVFYQTESSQIANSGRRRANRMYAYDDYGNTPADSDYAYERLTSIDKTDDENLEFKYILPSVMGLGFAYTNDYIQFEINVKQYLEIDEYDILGSSDVFQQQQTNQATLLADVLHKAGTPDSYPGEIQKTKSVTYGALAFSYAFNQEYQLVFGVFNDPSFIEESFFFDSLDLTGVTIGVNSEHEKSSTSYGIFSTVGTKDNDGIIKSYTAFGAVVSGSMYF